MDEPKTYENVKYDLDLEVKPDGSLGIHIKLVDLKMSLEVDIEKDVAQQLAKDILESGDG